MPTGMMKVMRARHSVRSYSAKRIEGLVLEQLLEKIDDCNLESGLNIQLVLDEPKAFSGRMAHYGNFSGVRNYIAMIGKKSPDLDEKCGYYGEKIVLYAQQLGLNTCWVALTYDKVPGAYEIREGEKLRVVIAIGYGMNKGISHRSKPTDCMYRSQGYVPSWFLDGMDAAVLAPTAMNQQKFKFLIRGKKGEIVIPKAGIGPCTKIDLGIAKYHFELGAGPENFTWG